MAMSVWMPLVASCISVAVGIFSIMTFFKNKSKDHINSGKQTGLLLSDIGYLKDSAEQANEETEKNSLKLEDLSERIIRLEESNKEFLRRLDKLSRSRRVNFGPDNN